jgi:hypothetical protein
MKAISRNEALILIAVVLFILALALMSCNKQHVHPNQANIYSIEGCWYIDTIIVNLPPLSASEMIMGDDTITITSDTVFYESGLIQGYKKQVNELKFKPASEYHPANAVISEQTATRMVWDTNEKHRRIRRILRKI